MKRVPQMIINNGLGRHVFASNSTSNLENLAVPSGLFFFFSIEEYMLLDRVSKKCGSPKDVSLLQEHQEEILTEKICEVYEKISNLESLKPSKETNRLFTQLVLICMPQSSIDVSKLSKGVQEIRSKLIKLCGEAEGFLEYHYSSMLGTYENPLDHLHLFPYYTNYMKLSLQEFTILSNHIDHFPKRIAFVGSGPLPLTSIVLAKYHLTSSYFDNFDIDPAANSMAVNLVASDPDLSKRVSFHTFDIMDVSHGLKDYDVVFLAALVGLDKEEKVRVVDHLEKHMAPGSILMLRSAHGARAFLYPVIEPCDLQGFEVLSVFHPTDEVINSIIVVRKYNKPPIIFNGKCSETDTFNPGNIMEEMSLEDQVVNIIL